MVKSKATKIINLQKVSEEAKKTMLADWLFSHLFQSLLPNLRKAVIARNPVTMEELESIACSEERACLAVGERGANPITDPPGIACAIDHSRKIVDDLQKRENDLFKEEIKSQLNILAKKIEELSEKNNTTSGLEAIQCFRCQNWGHRQNSCPLRFAQNNCATEQYRGRKRFRSPDDYEQGNSSGGHFDKQPRFESGANFRGGRGHFRYNNRSNGRFRGNYRNFRSHSHHSNGNRGGNFQSGGGQSNGDSRQVHFENNSQQAGVNNEAHRGSSINRGTRGDAQNLNYRRPR